MNAGANAVLMAMLGGRGRGGAINGFLNSPNYDEERQKDALMNYGASLMGSQNQNNTTSGAVRQLGERLLGAVLTGYREKGYRDKEKTLGEQWGAITSRNDIPVGATLPVAKPKEGSTGDTAQDAASFEALAGGTAKGIDPDEWQKRFGGATMTPKWGATPSGTYAQQLRARARELYGDQLDPQVDRRISQLEQYDAFTEPERRMREEDRQLERDRWNEQRQWEREKFGQQMDLQRAQLAATRAASGRSAEKGIYDPRLGGYVRPDGQFIPAQLPPGYMPPGGKRTSDPALNQANAKQLKDDQDIVSGSQKNIDIIDNALSALDNGVATGPTFGAEKLARQFGSVVGIGDENALMDMEAIDSSLEFLRLNAAQYMKGAISDNEQEILRRAAGGSNLSPQGLREVLTTMKAIDERSMNRALDRRHYYEQTGSFSGWQDPYRKQKKEQTASQTTSELPSPPEGFTINN